MLAWRHSLQPSDAARRPEYFDCLRDCLVPPDQRAGKATLDPEKQRRRLCVLPGFDISTHPPASQCGRRGKGLERKWMGLPPDHANAGTNPYWAESPEDIEGQGCPGAWYRTDWVGSISKYTRHREDDGGRVENRLFSMTEDPLVIEAVQVLEALEEQDRHEYLRRYHAEQAAKNKRQQ